MVVSGGEGASRLRRRRRLAAADIAGGEGGANGGDEFGSVGFVYDGMETGTTRVGFESRGSEDSVEHDGSAWKNGVNFAPRADAVTKGHEHIENDEIGPQLGGFFDGGFAVGDLAADHPIFSGFLKQFCDGPAQEVMIVRD